MNSRQPFNRFFQPDLRALATTLLLCVGTATSGGLTLGCAKTELDESGGETHFLIKCESNETCTAIDGALRCTDGYCREPVADDVPSNDSVDDAPDADTPPSLDEMPVVSGSASGTSEGRTGSDEPVKGNPPTDNDEEQPPSDDDEPPVSGSDPEVPASVPGNSSNTINPFQGSLAHIEILGETRGTLTENAIIGDIDADGYDDFVILDGGNSGPPLSRAIGVRGAAYLFYGRPSFPATLDATEADLILRGAGGQVAGLGDINGDDFDDFGIAIECNFEPECGTVNGLRIIYGSSTRYAGEVRADQKGVGWRFGTARHFGISSAGDINGDGLPDVLVDTIGAQDAATTHLILGRTTALDEALPHGAADATFTGVGVGSFGPGDIDGDGYAEIIVPGTRDGNESYNLGLFYGDANRFRGPFSSADADATFNGRPLLSASNGIGDLDNDGLDELVLPLSTGSSWDGELGFIAVAYGRPERFSGSYAAQSILNFSIHPTTTLDSLGAADLDGNGWLDILIGDANDRTVAKRSGALSAVPGTAGRLQGDLQIDSSNGLLFGQIRQLDDRECPDRLGSDTAGGGDINGDGYEDALVGATGNTVGDADGGRAFVVFGSPASDRCVDDTQCEACQVCDAPSGAMLGQCVTAPEGTSCGDGTAGECDEPDTCDAVGTCQANRKSQGTPCGHAADSCSESMCDGLLALCPRKPLPECQPCRPTVIQRVGAVASSTNGSNVAAKAIDSSLGNTRWESVQAVDPQWIYVDLGEDVALETVVIAWEAASAADFSIQVAPDGTCAGDSTGCLNTNDPWVTAYTSPHYTQKARVDTVSLTATGRYVRILGTARTTAYGYSIYNVMILGNSPSTCEPVINCGDDVECGPCHVCSSGACVQLPAGVACGSGSDSECDNPDSCDESGLCRPNLEPAWTPCAADVNACTLDACDGFQPFCSHGRDVECGDCDGVELTPVAAVSSSSSTGHGPNLAIDDNTASFWSSTNVSSWIYVDFGAEVALRDVTIDWKMSPRYFCIHSAPNNLNWAENGYTCIDDPVRERIDNYGVSSTARYLRISSSRLNSPDGYAIRDITVHGDTNASCK